MGVGHNQLSFAIHPHSDAAAQIQQSRSTGLDGSTGKDSRCPKARNRGFAP
jgi:hypothetical protein